MTDVLVVPALSRRELEVLALVAEGLTNPAISRRLCLCVKSVESVLGSVFLKLGLLQDSDSNRRVLAVRWYLATQ